jgi:hypothetical protein
MQRINFSKVLGTLAFVVFGMTTLTNIMFIPRTLGLIMWIIRIFLPLNVIFFLEFFPHSKISQIIIAIYSFF